uniref:Fucosyltransferase n=1 Tax=Timema cristinae TaxID=61476 RepID=A0A7R9GXE6_TIMCR|nr:unnamed protein product [Timema cristinae]
MQRAVLTFTIWPVPVTRRWDRASTMTYGLSCRAVKRSVLGLVALSTLSVWLLLYQGTTEEAEGLYYEGGDAEDWPGVNWGNVTFTNVSLLTSGNWRRLSQEQISHVFSLFQISNLSVLGRRMFLGEDVGEEDKTRNFTILIWKHGPYLERRFLRRFSNKLKYLTRVIFYKIQDWNKDLKGNDGLAPVSVSHSAFEDCPVSNCKLTYEESVLPSADAVLFHLHRTRGRKTLPSEGVRPEHQRWVFLTDESPYHTIPEGKLTEFNGVFNWSMSYRSDSDVPVPYGRALLLTGVEKVQMAMREANKDYHRNNTKMAAILISNCGGNNGRVKYLDELKKHLQVDVYGHCGNLPCEGHYESNCLHPNEYKFYLSFENSNCREYLTEKVWFNAYLKNSVPVIMGAPLEDCRRLLPPGSYVHVDAFKSPGHLASYLKHLAAMPAEYNALFSWKKLFKVVNEHGYFDAPVFHYCRLCEALNYNERSRKVYENLDEFT